MSLSKNNKWKDWKHRFFYIETPNHELNFRYSRFCRSPYLAGKNIDLPPLSSRAEKEIMASGLFRTKVVEVDGERLIVPSHYAPSHEWLEDPVFLSAFNLSPQYDQGNLDIFGVLFLSVCFY